MPPSPASRGSRASCPCRVGSRSSAARLAPGRRPRSTTSCASATPSGSGRWRGRPSRWPTNSVLSIDQLTTLRVDAPAETGRSLLDLLFGDVHFFSHRPRALEIDTPIASAGAEGTEFLMRVRPDRTEVVMFEGRVRLRTPEGELLLASGDAGVATPGAAPRPEIVARPRDAVAWALYYPPILAPLAERRPAPGALPQGLQTATVRVAANDYAGAIAALDAVPEAARDARYYTYRAGVLLNVGRVDEAAQAIDRALALDPEAADALAQRAVIAVVQNRRAEALADARRAVELDPDFGARPDRALLCAAGELRSRSGARDAARGGGAHARQCAGPGAARRDRAVVRQSRRGAGRGRAGRGAGARPRAHPDGAGLRGADPDRHRARPGRRSSARSSWIRPSRSPASASASPRSARATSRPAGRELEIAAALDPNNSLLRSYLGKAYFEEKRAPPGCEQLRDRQAARSATTRRPGSTTRSACRPRTARSRRCTTLRRRSSSTTTARPTARACCSTRTVARAADQPRAHLQRPRLRAAWPQRGDASRSALDPANYSRPPLPLGHLRRPAAPRDRPRQRAAAGAAAAADQHQPGPAEPRAHRPQRRCAQRPGARRLQRVHAAVRAQPGAADGDGAGRQQRHLRATRLVTGLLAGPRSAPASSTTRPTASATTTICSTTSTRCSVRATSPRSSAFRPNTGVVTPTAATASFEL